MTQLMAFPFAVGPSGNVVTLESSSDPYISQQIQMIIGTKPGERPMAWMFGVPDPAFNGLETGDIQSVLDTYGPYAITVTAVVAEPLSDTVMHARVEWAHDEDLGGADR